MKKSLDANGILQRDDFEALRLAIDDTPPEDGTAAPPTNDGKRPRAKKVKSVRDPNDTRPTIRLAANEIERIVDEAELALIRADRGLYQRNNLIVSVGFEPAIAADESKITVQRIFERGDYALLEDLSSAAHFEKFDARASGDGFVTTNPPMSIVKTMKQRKGRLPFPILSGVVNVPTMRADGSLVVTAGYDGRTGLLFDPLGITFPHIPDRPTRDDALNALALLKDLIGKFPFVDDRHRSVALSAILTALIRRLLPSAPLHAFSSPVPGTGKSLIVDTASTLVTGHEAAVTAQGANEEEFEKRLVSHLLAGVSTIAIDNCERPLGGEMLCQMLTQKTVQPRILGKSEAPTLLAGAFVTATGNNLRLVGDVTRRAIMCRLDAKVERPELREFDCNPVAVAKAKRSAYVIAALTILRAYHVAGRPQRPMPLGSFDDWSDLVRGALIWLGCADPVATIEEIRATDPRRTHLQALAAAWREVFRSEQVTVAQIIKIATEHRRPDNYDGHVEFVHEELREALLVVAGQGGSISGRALGEWLSKNKDRVVDGWRFEHKGTRQNVAVWALADEAAVG